MNEDAGVCLNAVVDEYIGLLRGLAVALRGAGPSPTAEEQASLIAQLDPLFEADKRLQHVIGEIRAEESFCAKTREAHTELAVAESAVQNAHNEALERVYAAQRNLAVCQRRVAILRGLSLALASGELNAESIVAMASRLAQSAGPPRGWSPGAQLYGQRPPCPTEDMMRCGVLFRRMNLGESAPPDADAALEAHTKTRDTKAPLTADIEERHKATDHAPRRSRRRRSSAGTGTDTRSDAETFLDLDLNPDM